MSREWVEMVRAGFGAVQRGDLEFFEDQMTPDVVMVQPPEAPDAKLARLEMYFGRDQVLEAVGLSE